MRHVWSAIVYVSLVPHGRARPPQSSTPLYWQHPHAHAPHITPAKSLNGLTSTFGFTRPVLASSTASKLYSIQALFETSNDVALYLQAFDDELRESGVDMPTTTRDANQIRRPAKAKHSTCMGESRMCCGYND